MTGPRDTSPDNKPFADKAATSNPRYRATMRQELAEILTLSATDIVARHNPDKLVERLSDIVGLRILMRKSEPVRSTSDVFFAPYIMRFRNVDEINSIRHKLKKPRDRFVIFDDAVSQCCENDNSTILDHLLQSPQFNPDQATSSCWHAASARLSLAGEDGTRDPSTDWTSAFDPTFESDPCLDEATGTLSWFSLIKGYGMIEPDQGHVPVRVAAERFRESGYATARTGTRVHFLRMCHADGPNVVRVLDAAQPPTPTAMGIVFRDFAVADWSRTSVKWFDRSRRVGALSRGEGTADILVCLDTVIRSGFVDLVPGQAIAARWIAGRQCAIAVDLRPIGTRDASSLLS